MRSVLIAAGFSLIISILMTPLAIRAFRRQGLGQEIRDDGPESHLSKKGTPTMGGTVIVGATVAGYLIAHLFLIGQDRKSTRLNSSHANISYAVFCLKTQIPAPAPRLSRACGASPPR